jgi:adenylate kinase
VTMSRIKLLLVRHLYATGKILANRFPGIKAESTMKSGALVPDAMILRLILHELKHRGWIQASASTMTLSSTAQDQDFDIDDHFVNTPSIANLTAPPRTSEDPAASFILDGFPRTGGQASQLDNLIPINLVVSLHTPAEVILERIAGRWVHGPSGRVYNTTFNAPKVAGRDDITGDKLTKRADDDEETWMTRLQKFQETSEPLLEHYAKKGVLWEVSGNSSDEISPKLFSEFEKRFVDGVE